MFNLVFKFNARKRKKTFIIFKLEVTTNLFPIHSWLNSGLHPRNSRYLLLSSQNPFDFIMVLC